jgi:polysaccharide export outer membrane protein
METMNERANLLTPVDASAQEIVWTGGRGPRLPARRMLRRALAVSAVAALPACTSVSNFPPAPPVPSPEAGYTSYLTPYRIQIGDVLSIRLLLNPELNEDVTVRPDGHISTTVVSDERAYGRTVPQLAAALQRDYSSQLQNPHLTVVVRSFAPTRIYVGGEVNTPGEFISVGPPPTLSQAISRAGGLRLSGAEGSVFIIRRGPGNRPEFLSTRWGAIQHASDPAADVELAPFDVVYVPRTGIAEVYRYFNQYLQQFVPVSWGFSYVVGNGGTGATVVQSPAATH